MPVLQQLLRRFEELESELTTIKWSRSSDTAKYASGDEWRHWATSAMHLIHLAFGGQSPHYANFKAVYDHCFGYDYEFAHLKGVFLGASSDYRGGYITSIESSLSAEILSDFIIMAELALNEGQKNVAAVLACAALEDTMKRFARLNGLDVDERALQEVVAALKSKGLVSGAQRSLLDVMPKLRDFAMHANWEKIQDTDVRSVLGFVEQFLLTKF